MAVWDPTQDLGDPHRLDAAEVLLSSFDPLLDAFAKVHNATKENRFHGAPNRRIYATYADCLVRLIQITPIIVQTGPLITERFWIDGAVRLDESGTRIGYAIPRRVEFQLVELKHSLGTVLEQLWKALEKIDRNELQRIGRRSRAN